MSDADGPGQQVAGQSRQAEASAQLPQPDPSKELQMPQEAATAPAPPSGLPAAINREGPSDSSTILGPAQTAWRDLMLSNAAVRCDESQHPHLTTILRYQV